MIEIPFLDKIFFKKLFQMQVMAQVYGVTYLAMCSLEAEEASGRKTPAAL